MSAIESEDYRAIDCVTEIIVGAILGLFSVLSFIGFFPLDILVFFLIPSVVVLGWVFMKITITPEKLTLNMDRLEYFRGSKKIFSIEAKLVNKVSWDEGAASQTLYEKRLIICFIDGSECSYPYRYLSDRQLAMMNTEIHENSSEQRA